jgi:hypothetical protein
MSDAYEYPDINECQISPTEAIKRLNIKTRAPRIKWGRIFEEWSDSKKIAHLKKFGESMNHAAALKQKEFVELCGIANRQEEQLVAAKRQLGAQTASYNQQIAHMNKVQQDMAAEIAGSQGPTTKARRILKMGLKKGGDLTEYIEAAIEALSDGD